MNLTDPHVPQWSASTHLLAPTAANVGSTNRLPSGLETVLAHSRFLEYPALRTSRYSSYCSLMEKCFRIAISRMLSLKIESAVFPAPVNSECRCRCCTPSGFHSWRESMRALFGSSDGIALSLRKNVHSLAHAIHLLMQYG